MNYGTIVIVDGSFQAPPNPSPEGRRGFARMERGMDGALRPPMPAPKSGGTTLVMELHYNKNAYLYGGPKSPIITKVPVSYSKTVRRLSTSGGPVASAKRLVAEYAGCAEAHKVRGRAIALSRIHRSISGEVFRFPLEEP